MPTIFCNDDNYSDVYRIPRRINYAIALILIMITQTTLLAQADGVNKLDLELIGEWKLLLEKDAKGNPLPLKPEVKGMSYTFYSNGVARIRSPWLTQKFSRLNSEKTIPAMVWSTVDGVLYLEGGDTGKGVNSSKRRYRVSRDSLVLMNSSGLQSLFVRKPTGEKR